VNPGKKVPQRVLQSQRQGQPAHSEGGDQRRDDVLSAQSMQSHHHAEADKDNSDDSPQQARGGAWKVPPPAVFGRHVDDD